MFYEHLRRSNYFCGHHILTDGVFVTRLSGMWGSQCDRLCGLWQTAVLWANCSFICGNMATWIEQPDSTHTHTHTHNAPSFKQAEVPSPLQHVYWLNTSRATDWSSTHTDGQTFLHYSHFKWCHVCLYKPLHPNCPPEVLTAETVNLHKFW